MHRPLIPFIDGIAQYSSGENHMIPIVEMLVILIIPYSRPHWMCIYVVTKSAAVKRWTSQIVVHLWAIVDSTATPPVGHQRLSTVTHRSFVCWAHIGSPVALSDSGLTIRHYLATVVITLVGQRWPTGGIYWTTVGPLLQLPPMGQWGSNWQKALCWPTDELLSGTYCLALSWNMALITFHNCYLSTRSEWNLSDTSFTEWKKYDGIKKDLQGYWQYFADNTLCSSP